MPLPPELLLDILELDASTTRKPHALLAVCCLAGRDLRNIAEPLLFRKYSCIRSIDGAESWLSAEASTWTEVLHVAFPPPDPRTSDEDLVDGANYVGQILRNLIGRTTKLKTLDLQLSGIATPACLDHPNLRDMKHLELCGGMLPSGWQERLPTFPPAFILLTLAVNAYTSEKLLRWLAPSCEHLQSLDIGIDYIFEDTLPGILALFYASRQTLLSLVMRQDGAPRLVRRFLQAIGRCAQVITFHYYGPLCECCCADLVKHLPTSLDTLVLSTDSHLVAAQLLRNTILAADYARDAGGGLLLPHLRKVVLPETMREELVPEQLMIAEKRGIALRFVTPRLGI
ncbi:hypothetical protein JCM10450v2_005261 [Rhodotorula kratochvilovae]